MEVPKLSICQALHQKYSDDHLESNFENLKSFTLPPELVTKFKAHDKREQLYLDGCNITCAGDDIKITCPLLKELDISKNHFKEWREVFAITSQLKDLRFLNLGHNPLNLCTYSFDSQDIYHSLSHLILTGTRVSFNVVYQLLLSFPSIEELHLSLNSYDNIPLCEKKFLNMQTLYFAQNKINTWRDVENLGQMFPSLQNLILCDNDIVSVDSAEHFSKLEKLSLSNTGIADWSSLDMLAKFPSLNDVRLKDIPLLNIYTNSKERLYLLMSRLPSIKTLNGGKLNENEREDAERFFLRHYKYKDEKPERYHELVAVHGEVPDLVDIRLGPRQDMSKCINVLIVGDIGQSVLYKLDTTLTAFEFKRNISKRFSLRMNDFQLWYHDSDSSQCNCVLTSKIRKLYMFYMKEGDRIELRKRDK